MKEVFAEVEKLPHVSEVASPYDDQGGDPAEDDGLAVTGDPSGETSHWARHRTNETGGSV